MSEHIMIRAGFYASHAVGADFEETFEGPTRGEWDSMSPVQRNRYLDECAETAVANSIESFAEVVDGDAEE